MASNVESGFYWMGFASGFNGEPWTAVTKRGFQPGTRAFHQFNEGSADGLKARYLAKRSEFRRTNPTPNLSDARLS